MTISGSPRNVPREGKYARVERERRFLVAGTATGVSRRHVFRITDRYITGTRLRLRRMERLGEGTCEFKLTQKVPASHPGTLQGLITNVYLTSGEYDRFTSLPARVLSKSRLITTDLGIDVFDPPLQGLLLAEVEFNADDEATTYHPPAACIAEVTADIRFTGGRLIRTSREELLGWLSEYGIVSAPAASASQ
jgi:CYTH domain-containing protein